MWQDNEEFIPLTPINFFHINSDCHFIEPSKNLTPKNYHRYLLPNTSALCDDDHFADVAIGWNYECLEFLVEVNKAFEDCTYPKITQGDSVELMIDTRDLKTSGYNTRFCHHFFFLPKEVEGHQAGEITHFRTEDTHELCHAHALTVNSQINRSSYSLHITIPKECLHGFEPDQFNRLGFTYRINRPRFKSQHFSVVTEEFQIEQQPSLWSSLKLLK